MGRASVIEVRELTRRFGDFLAVDRVSFDVLQGDACQLEIVVKQAVVDAVITDLVRRKRPVDTRGVENDGKRAGVLGPGQDLPSVMDQENVRTFLVPRGLHLDTCLLGHVLIDEFQVVLHYHGVHTGGRADLELEHGPLFVQLLGCPAQFLAEEFPQLVRYQGIVHSDGARLGAAAAQVATIGKLYQAHHGFPVQVDVTVNPR